MIRPLSHVFLMIIVTLSAAAVRADEAPATQPAAVTTDLQVQTLAPMTWAYIEVQQKFVTLPNDAPALIDGLVDAASKAGVRFIGPCIFHYVDATMDQNKPFTLKIGYPVPPGTKAGEGFKVEKYPAIKVASVIHTGPMSSLKSGYHKLFTQLYEKGLKPLGPSREVYFFWESADSVNDVTWIQVEVE